LSRLRSGDRSAFAELVENHSAHIYGLALRMVDDPMEAEEILQETFLQAVRHIGSFRGDATLGTWLHRIAANQALMRLRRRQTGTISLEDDSSLQSPQENLALADWSSRPESELLSQEARREIETAIRGLPDRLRVVFVLRDVEGYSTAETAGLLDLSASAVKSRLMRARLQLRDRLSAYYDERIQH